MIGMLLEIFVCTGLLVYWFARTWMLLRANDEVIEETLDNDIWWGRRLILSLRSAIEPPQQLAG